MAWADLAVTSASVTSLELAYMGVPMATAVLAENQEGLAAGLVERGAAIDLGSCDDLTPQQISQAVSSLLVDRIGRQAMSDAGRAMVDGRGAVRIMAVMGRDFLHLRRPSLGIVDVCGSGRTILLPGRILSIQIQSPGRNTRFGFMNG
jgi:UDP-2,4-diacetamido-2,4,6-trideoxy-beta-L-altropyranose hydrolase